VVSAKCFIRLCTSSGYLTNALPEGDGFLDSGLVREYEDIFINVVESGAFESSDIEWNGIRISKTLVPGFVVKFEQELNSKPGLAPDVCCVLFP
jgi:hypothetical protein